MKTLHVVAALLLLIAFTTCQKDNDKFETYGIVTIVDGKITGPEWLVHKVDSVAHKYNPSPVTGEYSYPQVYLVKHKKQEYILIENGLSSTTYFGRIYFTLSGEPIGGYPEAPTIDLYTDLDAEKNRTLLWRKTY